MAKARQEATRAVVREVVREEVERIDSPAAAAAIVRELERRSAGTTEQEQAEAAAGDRTGAARQVAEAAETGAPRRAAAKVLVEAAAEAVAPTADAPAALEGARDVLAPEKPVPPDVQRGRDLLKAAVLARMHPLEALDARIYLAVNGIERPRWLDAAFSAYTSLAVGGWSWIGGTLLATALGVPGSRTTLLRLAPTVTVVTLTVEYPVKAVFRRRRPFIDIVRALVIGKRPGGWSFPSGHTAASFAAARILGGAWPRATPVFYGLAVLVGFSRVYVGAHYPGDVLSGAAIGTALATIGSRLNQGQRPLRRSRRPHR